MTESRLTNALIRLAAPLLSSIFVHAGLDAVRRPESKVKSAERVTKPLSESFAFIPDDPAVLVKLNGAVQVGAGVLLASGILRRPAALVLMGSLVPTTYAGHQFWTEVDDTSRAQQQIQFAKNLGLFGGLMLMAALPRRQRGR